MATTKAIVTRRTRLKDELDRIDATTAKEVTNNLVVARAGQIWGMWRKGREIESSEFSGLNSELCPSYHELEKKTGRTDKSLKSWHSFFLTYPRRELAEPEVLRRAKEWAKKFLATKRQSLVSKLTGNAENYTPATLLEKVRLVLGEIDLDPASCEYAQKLVKAKRYYTEADSGLTKPWAGRVFLNPPYGMPAIRDFTDKLVSELPNIDSAVLLTNDQTDTLWWHKCARHASEVCFYSGRIHFYTPDVDETSPTNGQTLMYFGTDRQMFVKVFSEIGLLMRHDTDLTDCETQESTP